MDPRPRTRTLEPHRWVVFSTICLVYFFVYFHRVSTSVIATDLLETFNTGAVALGFMSSMYFYIYALTQPVVGYLADRIGPRRVIGYWSLASAAGCLLFAAAPGIGWASLGRALIGLGVGGVYVPAIKALSLWFRKKEFTTMLGLLMAVGNFGALIATAPLAWAAGLWGWRATFLLIGGVTLVLAVVTLTTTRDHSSQPTPARGGKETAAARPNILGILANGQFWIIAVIFFGVYGTLVTLQGLWATPFLMAVLNIERIAASKINMLIPAGVIVGALLCGWLTDRLALDKRGVLIGIVGMYTATWTGVRYFHGPLGAVGLALLLSLMGVAGGGFISTLWGIVRDTTPTAIMGLKSGLLNPSPFLGVAAFQVLTGAILDRSGRSGQPYPLSGYESAFTTCLLAAGLCLVLCFFIRGAVRSAQPATTR